MSWDELGLVKDRVIQSVLDDIAAARPLSPLSVSAVLSENKRLRARVAELDRLRSENAALRYVGNELAGEACQAAQLPTHGNDHRDSKRRLNERANAWRSTAGTPTTDEEAGR